MTLPSDALLPEQIKAARALLAWSQQDLAAAAKVATSTVADFERGVRTPVTNNAQAIRDALEGEGLQFVAGGVVAKSMMAPPPAPQAGGLVRWINATDLSQWGERRDGQSGMPELISRLIYATVGADAEIRFPSDESIQFPGWDGVCVVAAGAPFIPAGASVWEIGAQRNAIRAKAEEDFTKRTSDPLGRRPDDTTFVFVTPQRFPSKESWVAEKKTLGVWRDVIVIDADDLVHWLERAPAVAQWLAVRIGRRPEGLRNMEEVWAEWIRATETPLTPDVVLVGRDVEQKSVLQWLRNPPEVLAIQAEAPDEGMAFLFASASPLPEPFRLTYWSRCVVADSPDIARRLIGLGTPLIIVVTEPEPGLARQLVDDGHHVFAVFGANATGVGGLQVLPRPWRYDLERALSAAGVAEEDAHRWAHLSGRSITVLRRLMPAAPQFRTDWARTASPDVIAAMFAGAWVDHNSVDREIVSELAGRPYAEVSAGLARLAELGGPLVRVGSVWKVASLLDLWTQIAGQVSSDQFDRFEKAFERVMGSINPRFDRAPKSPYYEEPGEFGDEPSPVLRRGLTEAMIALAVYPDRAQPAASVADRPRRAVKRLLGNAPAGLWWSLSNDFQYLAEAAPTAFLDALEDGLEGTDPAVLSLFRSDEGFLHPTEYLSHLLWALEMLARSPDYLTRAALLLARLDAIDPGGKWGNRPGASLRRIFVTWSPQTYASPEERLRVIDRVLQTVPSAGWKLLLNLAPKSYDVSEPSSKPSWRDFTPDVPETVTWQTVGTAAREIGQRLLVAAGDDVGRWRKLIKLWGSFDPGWRKQAITKLGELAASPLEPEDAEALRDTLRGFLHQHRAFADAEWAAPETELAPLDDLLDRLEPKRAEDRVRWLFKAGAGSRRPGISWQDQQAELEADQSKAADDLVAELDVEGIFTFAQTTTLHSALGQALSRSAASAELKRALLHRGLRSTDTAEAGLGIGLFYGLREQAGGDKDIWTRDRWREAIDEDWGEIAEARIVDALTPSAAVWADVAARSRTLSIAYWKAISIFRLPDDADAATVVDHLIDANRSREAVAWLGNIIGSKPDGQVLIRTLKAAAVSDERLEGNDATMFGYYVGLILDRLDEDPHVTQQDIVGLEWIYFQALRHSQRPPRTIQRALARDPELFSYLIKLIYLPAKDSGVVEDPLENPERTADLASQAYDVLHEWSWVPGADDQGLIDASALEDWVKVVRKTLHEVGRGDIGDSKIGDILSAAKRTTNEPWPPQPVREIIEMVRSRHLESGFEIGVYNRRGVTTRLPHDGGDQERDLAARYRADAEALRFDWPRTAACLERIASTYDHDAEREDISAQQRDWL